MSIERELLIKIKEDMKGLKFTPDFIDEIDRLLAQPEPESLLDILEILTDAVECRDTYTLMQELVLMAHHAGRVSKNAQTKQEQCTGKKFNIKCYEGCCQPEQTKQEPVGIVKTIGGYPDQSEHTVELTCRHGDLRDGDLLYKAPPKREPLSDEWIKNNRHFIHQDVSFTELVRGIEKAHGIGGGE